MSDGEGRDPSDVDLIAVGPSPRWGRRDRAWVWALVAVPVVVFVVPAMLGHPSIDADNLIQNFPLRVLAGRQLWGGHLPLLNPLTDSGTPLLGAMNAGALFPLTLLFAVLPPLVAWTINMVAVYAAGALGVYALARGLGLVANASGVAALVYAYGGAMVGQAVHLGVIQGYAILPWLLVAFVGLGRRLRATGPASSTREVAWSCVPYALAVAGLWGLILLTGEPRAIATAELVSLVAAVGVVALASSYRPRGVRLRVAYLATLAGGFVVGVGIGLVQVLPGLSFIGISQRHAISYAFFGAGSLPVRWTLLLVNPDLLGGNGALHQPGFFANYNLPEVTGYVGVVALCALFAFLTRLTRRGWVGAERDLTLVVALLVVGLFATWGNFTPVGHLFRALPLFGSTRLQSRNVALVDLALAVLLAWWLDRLATGDRRGAGLGPLARWVTALPALVVAGVSVAEIVDGPALVRWVGITTDSASLATGLTGADVVFAALGLSCLALVVGAGRWRHVGRALVAVCVVDLVAFSALTSTGFIGGPGPREASRAHALAVVGGRGRFALVDYQGTHTESYRALGQPNMNVFTGLASVQGYGSLLATYYDAATGTHPQNWVDPCALARGVFAPLRLSTIVVATQLLAQPGTADTPRPSSCLGYGPAPTLTRAFGEVLDVASIALRAPRGHRLAAGEVTVRFLSARGRPLPGTWRASGTGARALVRGAPPVAAAGLVVSAVGGVDVADLAVTTHAAHPAVFQLDSRFDFALSGPAWRLVATHDAYAVLRASTLAPRAWVARGVGRVTKVATAPWGDSWVSVRAAGPVVLERSTAYLPGWRATALDVATGTTRELRVYRRGLIDAVDVPRGEWVVHFHYHAPYIELASVGSLATIAGWAGVLCGWRARRRRRGKVAP